jgi:GT2 family glycosyltransferase
VRRGFESDPSAILTDYCTPGQISAQASIDHRLLECSLDHYVAMNGELLILIPFRDRWELTKSCLTTLDSQAIPNGMRLRTVLIDNKSESLETRLGLQESSMTYPNLNIQILTANYEFNYSRLNNDGYRQFKSPLTKWVLFLNNDVELRDQTIVRQLAGCLASIPEVGVIGSTLFYPDGQIQHLFAAPGVKIIAAHPLKGLENNPLMTWFAKFVRPVPAVTGAVMMVRATDFESVGMFDESLPTMGQDIDLCLKFFYDRQKISATITKSNVIHFESKTRRAVFSKVEIRIMNEKWREKLTKHPFYSPAFSRFSEAPLLVFGSEPKYPVHIFGE